MKKYESRQRKPFRENAIHVGAGFMAKERPRVVDPGSTGAIAGWTAGGDVRNYDALDRLQRPLRPFGRQSLPVQFSEIR